MSRRERKRVFGSPLLLTWFVLAPCLGRTAETIEYNRDVRPILAENCFSCHGLDGIGRKADLRLDQRQAAIDSGVLVPGDPENSEFIARIDAGRRRRDHASAVVAEVADVGSTRGCFASGSLKVLSTKSTGR